MMLRWMNRDYGGVAALVSAIGTDSKYEDDEMQVFKHLGRITDPHPDSHANRRLVYGDLFSNYSSCFRIGSD